MEELLLPLSRPLVVVASLALLLPALEAAAFSNPLEERSVQRLVLDLLVSFMAVVAVCGMEFIVILVQVFIHKQYNAGPARKRTIWQNQIF